MKKELTFIVNDVITNKIKISYFSFSHQYFNYIENNMYCYVISINDVKKKNLNMMLWKGKGKHKFSTGKHHGRIAPKNNKMKFKKGDKIKIYFYPTNYSKNQYLFLNFFTKNNIKHINVSNELCKFNRIYYLYDLKLHKNNVPCLFFGIYNNDDLNRIKNHTGKRFIMFGGSDIKNKNIFEKFLKIINKNDVIISISKWMKNYMDNIKLKNTYLELDLVDYKIFKPIKNTGNCIYVYDGEGKTITDNLRKKIYNYDLVSNIIKKLPEYNFIRSSKHNNNYVNMPDIYKKCFIGIRLTEHDGNANTVQEFKAMNMPIVHNHSDYGLKWKNIDDILNHIKIYYIKKKEKENNNNLFKIFDFNEITKHPYFGIDPLKLIKSVVPKKEDKILKKLIPSYRLNENQKISVVILNFLRPKNVKSLVNRLLLHSNITEIIISNGKKETEINFGSNKIIKCYDDSKKNNIYGLHLRFYRAKDAKNKKILIIDDDIILKYEQLEYLLKIDTDVIVGYYGRNIPYSGQHEKFKVNSFYYLPIILTKSMLINKELAIDYMKVYNFNSELIDKMKLGKPWGNGEDILIACLSNFITNKLSICLNMNCKLIEDTGCQDNFAICKRFGGTTHNEYRKILCDFLYKDCINLTDKIKKIFTLALNQERIKFYFGNNIDEEKVTMNMNHPYLRTYHNINSFFKIHNRHYSEPFKNLLKQNGHINKKFIIQFGDRCKRNNSFNSWSFLDNVTDDFSLVKIRRKYEKFPVILKCTNFERHWSPLYKKYNDIPFEKKKNILIWRGASTSEITNSSNRFKLVEEWGNYKSNEIDIGFSKLTNQYEEHTMNKYKEFVKGDKSIDDLLQYKYIISVEGNDKDSGLNWKLNSNSVILMCKPSLSSWLMEETLIPNYHYVEIKHDFSDIKEKLEWCINNQEKCLEIIKNANTFMKKFFNIEQENILENHIINLYFKKLVLKN